MGIFIAIVGRPNVGKSTLFNRLTELRNFHAREVIEQMLECFHSKCGRLLFSALFLFFCYSCDSKEALKPQEEFDSAWSNDSAWYQPQQIISDSQIDIFYIVSTEVISSVDSTGAISYLAQLSSSERLNMSSEFAYVETHYCHSDIRIIAPYYHQFTFEALGLPAAQFDSLYAVVADEVCEAFDYYMKYRNQGRRFALVGFSQGGMLVLDLLKHMSEEQFGQMVAAYAIGYRISTDDLKYEKIRPAVGETETGVTVSFNSVLNADAIWPTVAGGAVASINPINWKTDATPAEFTYEGKHHVVALDTATYQLIVEVDDASAYRAWNDNPVFQQAGVSLDCLHHFDLLFYTDFIHDNILKRAQVRP